jgi:hypothetical protein
MIERIHTRRLLDMLDYSLLWRLPAPDRSASPRSCYPEPISRNRHYITLDDLTSRTLAEKDPLALLEQTGPITIDEIQLAPGLLRGIKQQVDRDRSAGRYLITGSADLNYCADLSHVLAGRVGVLPLPPITSYEEQGMKGTPLWAHLLQEGTIDVTAPGKDPLRATSTGTASSRAAFP